MSVPAVVAAAVIVIDPTAATAPPASETGRYQTSPTVSFKRYFAVMFASIEEGPPTVCASPTPCEITGTFGVAVPAAVICPMMSARCGVDAEFACELSTSA